MADQLSPRRRFQFRLRTLMIVIALLAIPLGCVGRQVEIAREREIVRERIEKMGATSIQKGTALCSEE
jgi:hypothetical protein